MGQDFSICMILKALFAGPVCRDGLLFRSHVTYGYNSHIDGGDACAV